MPHRSSDYFDLEDIVEVVSCRQWLEALADLFEKQECYASCCFTRDAVAALLERERELEIVLGDQLARAYGQQRPAQQS